MDDKPSRKDKRYSRTPVRGVPSVIDRSEDETPVEKLKAIVEQLENNEVPPAMSVSGEIDVKRMRADIDEGWPHWEHFERIHLHGGVECRRERAARVKRKKWLYGLAGGSLGLLAAAAVFTVKALVSTGAAAEASRIQAKTVFENQARIRELELTVNRQQAVIEILLRKP